MSDLLLRTPPKDDPTVTAPVAVAVAAILVLDPRQAYSLRLLEKLVEVCQCDDDGTDAAENGAAVRLLAVSQCPGADG